MDSRFNGTVHTMKHNISMWVMSALLVACAEQRVGADYSSFRSLGYAGGGAGGVIDSVFESPASLNR